MHDRGDLDLIQAYAASSDEGAFAELAARHQKLVFRVCLRMLGDIPEAEDATQATFIVLARKASNLKREGDLGGWLHRVARNISLKALQQRRRCAMQKEAAMSDAIIMDSSRNDEVGRQAIACLDSEIAALPDTERQALMLRYFEGYNQEVAARLAGCALSTLAHRTGRGLDRLRQRLEMRGVALGGSALVGLLEAEAHAAVPETLLPSIVTAIKSAASGGIAAAGISSKATTLAEGALRAMFWSQVKTISAVVAVMAALGAGGAVAVRGFAGSGEVQIQTAARPAAAGPLAKCPSGPGAHLGKIKALGANQWLNLGEPTPDPEFGPVGGIWQSYKMAFAPDLRGAFVCGPGPNIATIRGGRRYYKDGLFFYDINAHSWICCHPGTLLDAPGPGLKWDPALQLETDQQGNVLPVAECSSVYWAAEYDSDLKRFMFMPSVGVDSRTRFLGRTLSPAADLERVKKDLMKWRPTPQAESTSSKYAPYYYDPQSGKFERRLSPGPRSGTGTALFYSPVLKKAVYFNDSGVWLYDHSINAWSKVSEDGSYDVYGMTTYCYDSRRDRVFVVAATRGGREANRLTTFDVRSGRWLNVDAEGDAGSSLDPRFTLFTYDSVNDVAVLLLRGRLHVFSPETGKWALLPDARQEKAGSLQVGSAFYDPETNAHFYFLADETAVGGNMWVYRYAAADRRPVREENKETL